MPTVRVDDEVYAWLQSQARPFEDTPNTVLRRAAGLDVAPSKSAARAQEVGAAVPAHGQPSGRKLNEQWRVGAKHALYHREGSWYNNLKRFPGALFDPKGYLVFPTENDFKSSPYLRITQETNVPGGIASVPGYVRVAE